MRTTELALVTIVGTLVCAFARAADPVDPIDPLADFGALRSKGALERLDADVQVLFEKELERFDQRLEEAPHDVVTAVEKCRYILDASYFYEGWSPIGSDEDLARCEESLERFGDHPEVALYRLSEQFDQESIDEGERLIAGGIESWTQGQRARLYKVLSDRHGGYPVADEAKQLRYGYLAHVLFESPETQVLAARYAISEGKEDQARRYLALEFEDSDYVDWYGRLHAYADLGDVERVDEIVAEIESSESLYLNSLSIANIYRELGRRDRARQYYANLPSDVTAQRALFEMALDDGTPDEIARAYESLRDIGFEQDPLLRDRLLVALENPSAPWHARDLQGAAMLVATLLACLFLPAAWLLPIHHRGLIRQRSDRLPERRYWGTANLRDAWIVTGAMILLQAVWLLVFYYPDVVAMWTETDPEVDYDNGLIALSQMSFTTGVLVLGLAFLGRVGSPRWKAKGYPMARLAGLVILSNLLLLGAVLGWAMLVRKGQTPVQPFAIPSMGETWSAIHQEYGLRALFLWVGLLAPIGEEIVFRGVLLRAFAKHVSFGWSTLLQSVLFAWFHGNPGGFPVYLLFGLVVGELHRRTGGLLAPILVHAIHNSMLSVLLIYAAT